MSEFTRPTAMIGYATAVGAVASTIFLNNKISENNFKVNAKINDLTEDINIIRDGVKEKVPIIEKGMNHMADNIKGIAGVVTNHSNVLKKLIKMEKRLSRCLMAVEDVMNALETIETRQLNLISALKTKGVLDGTAVEISAPAAPVIAPKPAPKPKKTHRLVSSDEESESSSEDERRTKKKSRKSKSKSRNEEDDDDDDEVGVVARLASRK
jgi:hypothetical protein